MEEVIFQQDPQIRSEKFILRGNTLRIVGGAPSREKSFRLSDISADFEKIERRFSRSYLVPLFLAGLFGVVSWKSSVYASAQESWVAFIVAGISGFMGMIFLFFMKFTPIEAARFRDKQGNILFEIYRPSKMAHAYDDFLSALSHRLKGSNRSDS
jgi:hypothetical protein